MSGSKNNSQSWLIALLLAFIVAAVFWPLRQHDFVNFDDDVFISRNSHVATGWTSENVRWAFSRQPDFYWRPLTWLSMMLDCEVHGLKPGGHHFTSLALHVASTVLLFLVLRRMTRRVWPSAFVAALFGLHPLHVESVAWSADRVDVLSGFFWMLAWWAYLRYAESSKFKVQGSKWGNDGAGKTLNYLLSLLFFAMALMSKPTVVTFPFVLLLLDFWPLVRVSILKFEVSNFPATSDFKLPTLNFTKLLLEKVPFFALAFVASLFAVQLQTQVGATRNLALPLSARIDNAFISYIRYLTKFFWPQDLATPYPHPMSWPKWQVIGAIVILLVMTVLAIRIARRRPWLAVGWLWFVGTMAPTIGLIQVGYQSMADRYTYLPLIGLFIAVTFGAMEVVERWPQRSLVLTGAAVAVLLGCVVTTSVQLRYWQNTETLFSHVIAVTKNNFIAHNNLGFYLAQQGRFDESIKLCQTALEIKPNYTDARNNLAFALSQQHRMDEAIQQYELALQARPDDVQTLNNLGSAYKDQQKWEQATACFAKAIAIDPKHADALYNFALALVKMGKTDEAIARYEEAIRLRPDFAAARANLGNVYLRQGKIAEAREQYQAALKYHPDDLTAWNNLGSTFLRENKFEEAIAAYSNALHYNPGSVQAHFNRGLALAGAGRRDDAAAEFREVLRINPDFTQAREQLNQLSAANNSTAK